MTTKQDTPDNINVDDQLDLITANLQSYLPPDHFEYVKGLLHKLLVAERLSEIDVLRNGYGWGDALETSEFILSDREKDLQAQLTQEPQKREEEFIYCSEEFEDEKYGKSECCLRKGHTGDHQLILLA